jgi:predicted DNA-binding transcriptional regulator AlpA
MVEKQGQTAQGKGQRGTRSDRVPCAVARVPSLPPLLTYDDLVRRLGVSRTTIERWIGRPDVGFPCPIRVRGTRFVRWRAEDIEAWEKEHGLSEACPRSVQQGNQ